MIKLISLSAHVVKTVKKENGSRIYYSVSKVVTFKLGQVGCEFVFFREYCCSIAVGNSAARKECKFVCMVV